MTTIAMPTTSATTDNGTAVFLDNSLQAAQQASLDVANFAANGGAGGSRETAATGDPLGTVAGIANAVFTAGLFAVGIAGATNDDTTGQLQIDLINYSSNPVVVYNYNPSNANVTDVPTPLAPGDNDLFLLTLDEEFDTDSSLVLYLLIGSGTTGSIQTAFTYGYTDDGKPGRWSVQANIDGAAHTFPNNLQLFGATFTGNEGYPNFSVYTSTIETASGDLSLSVYDLA